MRKRGVDSKVGTRHLGASVVATLVFAGLLPLLGATPAVAQDEMLGIDVSHHQGTINWTRVAESGQRFAFHKATEGATFVDDQYVTNRGKAGEVSIPFGAYHF